MKLYSVTLSPFSAKVRIVLAEKGITADITEIPWSKKTLWGPKPPAFLAASRRGEVPALSISGTHLVDSTVINEYLEDAHPTPALMPEDALLRAQCRGWEHMADEFLADHITTLISEVFMKPDGAGQDQAAVDGALQAFAGYLDVLNAQLAHADYLCGEFSVADIATWICLAFAQTLGVSTADHPQVQSWFALVQARPAVSADFQQIMAAVAQV